VLRLLDTIDDVALARDALAAGVAVRPLSGHHAQAATAPKGLLLGHACIKPEAIAPSFKTLAGVVNTHCNRACDRSTS
jgi:GntR family transcriptional regulator/MocR family aminotransferase